jgi:hypothetical protein
MSVGRRLIAILGEIALLQFVGEDACLWQSVHAFLNFDVDLSVLRELVQIVLFDRFLREQRQIDHHIFKSSEGGVQIKIRDVNDKELGALGGNDTID